MQNHAAFRTFVRSRFLWLSLISLLVILIGVVASNLLLTAPKAQAAAVPAYAHVVVVIEENHAANQIIGSTNAPYINSLASQGALFTNSHAVSHPSEPNYMALFSGSTQGLTSDACPVTFAGPDLGGELIKAGKTYDGYSESMPSVGYTGCTYNSLYARKHNAGANFSDVPASTNLPFTSFPTNFSSLPTVSFVDPNLQDDMHDGSVQKGDTWLKADIDKYAQWAKTNNSLLIVTWDENDGSTGNIIPTIFVGQHVKVGKYTENINHYNVLRTIEDMYALPYAHSSSTATTITDCWN
jgi:phosphatidylinositol-3-phosphatase